MPDSNADTLAETPPPPYWAVIFTSLRNAKDEEGYAAMVELAAGQPGYLGIESVRGQGGLGITVSYWKTLEAIANWKQNAEHLEAQRLGRERWYESFTLRVARVERTGNWLFPGILATAD